MKLKDDFFKILNINKYSDKIEYTVQLDAAHPIYRYHFPENPVTPGVCIIQTVKELVAENVDSGLFLQKIARIRYFRVINPVDNPIISVSLDISDVEGGYNVAATVFSGETVFSQLSLLFIITN
ncbi:MAG: hypothetical protein LBQ70_04890 [Prevotellaceae bacterium]|jgi:3-hydroxyacyl-[acyl-carrier-protein] dehydratase|nr:hypothetical protein [Prevotellaceae bacterium]